jgi:hypothetical protein
MTPRTRILDKQNCRPRRDHGDKKFDRYFQSPCCAELLGMVRFKTIQNVQIDRATRWPPAGSVHALNLRKLDRAKNVVLPVPGQDSRNSTCSLTSALKAA